MARKLLALAFFCLVTSAYADQVAVSTFKGINNNESSVIIGQDQAQDALNVEITPGGKSVKKRAGYGLYKTLYATPPAPVHGGYHFFDTTGNDVQVWGSSTSLYSIVADGTPTQLVSSATLSSTWDCTDTQGSAYCVTSNRDAYIKTTGASIVWNTSPLGTMVEATPDRIAVAGVAAAPSSIYLSGSNSFTTFTVGPLTTDPFIEPIAAPGSKLTHLRWGCGKLLWWKDQSFGWFAFEDQYTASVKIVSDNIGTFDNTSAIDPGGNVWFRGQDGHIWQYDCSGLIKQSIEITPFVQASGRRTSDSWTQTTQSDWNSGAVIPALSLSTAIVSGDVLPGSFTVTENSSASGWGSGSAINFAVGTSSLSLKNYITDPFSSMGNWTQVCGTVSPGTDADFGSSNHAFNQTSTPSPSGDFILQFDFKDTDAVASNEYLTVLISTTSDVSQGRGGYYIWIKAVGVGNTYSVFLSSTSNAAGGFWNDGVVTCNSPGVSAAILYISSFSFTYDTSYHTLKLLRDNTSGSMSLYLDGTLKTTASNTDYSTFARAYVAAVQSAGLGHWHMDNFYLNAKSGSFTSQIFNTSLTSATYQLSNFAWTVDDSSVTFALLTSTSNPTNNWITTLTSSGTNSVGNKYARYVATITVNGTEDANTSITASTILARSSGTLYSQWKNAPNFTQWSTFNPTKSDGDGSHTFYVRASTSPQSVLNSTVTWVAQTADALVATSTVGVYFQIRDDFTIGAATNTPTLNAFTVNWFEGNATDQAYMHYFDNAIWTSVAYGVGISTNNYIFRRDLINDGWVVYGFGAGGFLTQNAHLFFGGVPATAKIYQFGSGTSDEGTAINAYWKSKDFTGGDPFLQNQYTQIDSLFKQNSNQSVTTTYDLDTSTTTTSYSIYLSSTTQSIVNHRKQLPAGKNGYLFNIQYGDNTTTSAWELLGYRFGFTPQTYRPSN